MRSYTNTGRNSAILLMLAGTYSGYGIALGYISSGKSGLAMERNTLMGLMPSSPTPSSCETICSPGHH